MSCSLRQIIAQIYAQAVGFLWQVALHMSNIVHLYLQAYYPFVYMTDLVIELVEYKTDDPQATLIALLWLTIETYQCVQPFFPWVRTRIWYPGEVGATSKKSGDMHNYKGDELSMEDLESIDLDTGLTNEEALLKRKKYGLNVLWTGRSWSRTFLQRSLAAGNLIPEVCIYTR